MARISRVVVPRHPHHVTQRGVRSMNVFDTEDDRQVYLQLIKTHAIACGVEILAWCLMTNHVHFIAIPEEESSLAKAFGEAHRLYTRMKNFRQDVRGYLFQGRFSSCVLDEQHLIAAARYIEQNPVRAKMVRKPWDYQWSSAKFHMGGTDPLVADRTLLGLVKDWGELLQGEDAEANDRVRAGVKTGRPVGSQNFLKRVEAITGRDLRKGHPGRPAKPQK
ncbi:transposase [Geomonas nitrogeniifigens]|nr:transposase [Geomonas nitrogeniifigens]